MNQPQPPPFTIAELGAKFGATFGAQLAQTFGEIITLEKLLGSQNKAIEEMEETEKALSNRIQELEAQAAEFAKKEGDFVDHIQALEAKLNISKTADKVIADVSPMSEAAVAIASQARKIIEGK